VVADGWQDPETQMPAYVENTTDVMINFSHIIDSTSVAYRYGAMLEGMGIIDAPQTAIVNQFMAE
jgi:hypothetical protein